MASLDAAGQSVSLDVAGGVNNASSDASLQALNLNITAASVGEAGNGLNTDVGSLVLNLDSGAAYVDEANGLVLSQTTTGVFDLNAAGDVTAQDVTATGAVSITVTGEGNDLSVASLDAAGQSVTLDVAGTVVGGTHTTDVVAASLQISAEQVGSAGDPFQLDVDQLSLALGDGGGYLSAINGLVMGGDGVTSTGDLSVVVQSGDLQLDADVQMVGDANLTLQAVSAAVTQTGNGSVTTEAGNVAITGSTGVSVARVGSDTGLIQVLVTDGPFVVPAGSTNADYGSQPVRIQGTGVQIDSPLSGSGSIEITTPSQQASLSNLDAGTAQLVLTAAQLDDLAQTLPIVVGDTLGGVNGAPVEGQQAGLFIDVNELANISDGFERIVIGSQDPRQAVWLNAPVVNGVPQSLVFRDPLVLVASGVARDAEGGLLAAGAVHITGTIDGQGLTILGSGSTTDLTAAQLRQAGDVLISDDLVVHSDSVIEVTTTGGVLDIRGSILVKSGATLNLSASDIRLGAFASGSGDRLVLEAGATLVLGTQRLTVDSTWVIDGGGAGGLVLQGATFGGVVQDFALSTQDLEALTAQMVDDSFDAIQVGHATADTTVMSPSLWAEGADAVRLLGTTVRLGADGEAASWAIDRHTRFEAVGGDLVVNADLLSSNASYLNLHAADGQVRMASDARIVTQGGLVTIDAAFGIEVGQIDASGDAGTSGLRGAVALDSAQGQIVLAASSDGAMGVKAQSVSLYGYGQTLAAVAADDRVLRVEAERLQITAPSGLVSRGMNAAGIYYRLADHGARYAQAQLVGQAPERVMLPRTEVAGQTTESATSTALGAIASDGFTRQVQSVATSTAGRAFSQSVSMQAQAYLSSYVQPMLAGWGSLQTNQDEWIALDTDAYDDQSSDLADDLLLSDMAYGLAEEDDASFVMGLPAVQPISAGLSASAEVLFDYATL